MNAQETTLLERETLAEARLLRRISSRSRSLHERLGSAFSSSEEAASLLAPWIRIYGRDGLPALRRRLAWSGLSPEQAAAAFLPDEIEREAPFAAELAAYCRAAARLPSAAARAIGPFGELWQPWLAVAREGLADFAAERESFLPAAIADLESLLLDAIVEISALAALQRYRESVPVAARPAGSYQAFVRRTLADPLGELYGVFPALARSTCERVEQWRGQVRELAQRWQRDRRRVLAELGAPLGAPPGAPPGHRIARIQGHLSDRHHGGRSVLALELESGFRLVYKPRCVAVDRAFTVFLGWCRERGLPEAPPAPRVVDGDGYGWVEWIAQEGVASRDEAKRYHRSAGALLAIAHALRGRDLHAENLVATGRGPVVVDAEMLLQPIFASSSTNPGAMGARPADCLDTGLLIERGEGDRGEEREWGGLLPFPLKGATIASVLEWSGLGSDAIDCRVLPAAEQPGRLLENVLRLGGDPVHPRDFADDLRAGFRRAYGFLCDRREEILDPGGPLAEFTGARVRHLLRPSQEYAKLLTLLAQPRNQKSGLAGGLLYEAMIAGLVTGGGGEPPRLFKLVEEERAALLQGDLPRFTLRAESSSLETAGGEQIAGALALSGLDAVRRTLLAMGDEDLRRQERSIGLALGPRLRLDLGSGAPAAPPELLRETALALGRSLLERPEWRRHEEGAALDLGGGLFGKILFLAALERVDGSPLWRPALAELLAAGEKALLARSSESRALPALGGFEGLGSVVAALVHLDRIRETSEHRGLALRLAEEIWHSPIEEDRRFDLMGGAAGTLMAALALAATGPSAGSTESESLAGLLARRCGDHLLATARPQQRGAAWENAGGLALAGWAHGAAGIARALSALGAYQERAGAAGDRYFTAAAAGIEYEDSLFSEERANWPLLAMRDGRAVPGTYMNAWCHGAPGIVLSRTLMPRLAPAARVRAAAALERLASAPALGRLDHLCCGNLGRSALIFAGSASSGPGRNAALRLAAATVAAARRRGRFACSDGRLADRELAPSFLKGLAGIGYYLLRLSGAGFLPDVLACALPGEPVSPFEATTGDNHADRA